jgi:hypothetical protein
VSGLEATPELDPDPGATSRSVRTAGEPLTSIPDSIPLAGWPGSQRGVMTSPLRGAPRRGEPGGFAGFDSRGGRSRDPFLETCFDSVWQAASRSRRIATPVGVIGAETVAMYTVGHLRRSSSRARRAGGGTDRRRPRGSSIVNLRVRTPRTHLYHIG